MPQKSIYELSLDINTSAANLNKEAERVRKSINGITDLGKNLTKLAAGFVTVTGAIEFTRKAINSTAGSADKFEEVMGGLKLATDKFFSSIATGDFSNLLDGLKKAKEAGEAYASSMDKISERTLGLKLEKSIEDPEQKARMEIFRDKNADPAERQKALNDYKKTAIELATKENEIAKANVIAEADKLKGLGIEAEYLKLLYSNYNDNLPLIQSMSEKIQKGKDIMAQMNDEANKMIPSNRKINELGEQLTAIKANLSNEELKYFNALLTNDKAKQEHIDLYIASLIKENTTTAALKDINLETLKIQNQITNELRDQNNELAKMASMQANKANPITKLDTSKVAIPTLGKPFELDNSLKGSNNTEAAIQQNAQLNGQLEKQAKWLDDLDAKASLASNAIFGLSDAFTEFAETGKTSLKSVVTATLEGIRQILVAKFAEAVAGVIAGEAPKGLVGLATAAVGVSILTGLWKSKIPEFATGTNFSPSGLALVGENGPELVNLPRGSQVFTNSQSRNMLNGGGEWQKLRLESGDIYYAYEYHKKLLGK